MKRSQSVIAADVVKQIVFPNTDQAQIAFDHIVALDPVLYNAFDVNEFADKVETMGAGYVLFSVGQTVVMLVLRVPYTIIIHHLAQHLELKVQQWPKGVKIKRVKIKRTLRPRVIWCWI